MFDPSQKAANYEASDCYWRLTPIQSRNIPTYSVLLMSHFYWGMGQEIASVQLLDRLARGVNKSNIFSFFKIFWTLSPEPLSLVQLRNKASPYFAKSWGRWWNYFDHPEPLKSEMEKAFWIAPMQIGPQILAPKKHKLRLIRVTTKQHKSPKRPWKIWK